MSEPRVSYYPAITLPDTVEIQLIGSPTAVAAFVTWLRTPRPGRAK